MIPTTEMNSNTELLDQKLTQYHEELINTIKNKITQTEELTKFVNKITPTQNNLTNDAVIRKLNEFLNIKKQFTELFQKEFNSFLFNSDENW